MSHHCYVYEFIASISICLVCGIDFCGSASRRDSDVSFTVDQGCIGPLQRPLFAVDPDVSLLEKLTADYKVVSARIAENEVSGKAMAVQHQIGLKVLIHLSIGSAVVSGQGYCFYAVE